jgi:hypothetical protein
LLVSGLLLRIGRLLRIRCLSRRLSVGLLLRGRLPVRLLRIGLLLLGRHAGSWRLLLLRRRRWLLLRRTGRLRGLCGGRSLRSVARARHFIGRSEVAARLHLSEAGRGRCCLRLLDARDNHHRPARAKLHTRAHRHFRRLHDAPTVEESAEARIGINEQAAPVLDAKFGVLARDHRPFRLVENDVTLRRVASDFYGRVFISALGRHGLPVALFYENDFHDDYLRLILGHRARELFT